MYRVIVLALWGTLVFNPAAAQEAQRGDWVVINESVICGSEDAAREAVRILSGSGEIVDNADCTVQVAEPLYVQLDDIYSVSLNQLRVGPTVIELLLTEPKWWISKVWDQELENPLFVITDYPPPIPFCEQTLTRRDRRSCI